MNNNDLNNLSVNVNSNTLMDTEFESKKSSIKKIIAMRKLELNSGLLVTIAAKNTNRTFGPDQVCGVVCKGKI